MPVVQVFGFLAVVGLDYSQGVARDVAGGV